MARSIGMWALVVLVCGALGFLAGRASVPSGSGAELPSETVRGRSSHEAPSLATSPRLTGAPHAEVALEQGQPDVRGLLDDVNGALVQREVHRRAELIRRRASEQIAQAEALAQQGLEREIARERAVLEDAARGGTHAMLERLNSSWVVPRELLSDADRYGALFERKTAKQGAVADGPSLDPDTRMSDGDEISFPPGVHHLHSGFVQALRPFPKDLLFSGYGMDETLIRLSGWSTTFGAEGVHSLTFQDVTIHCGDAPLQVTRKTFTLRLIRCRVIGFDRGAGGTEMLNGGNGALYATDCRFEIGYGNAPTFASLFRVHGGFLARLEDCTIHGPINMPRGGRAACLFVRCRFVDMHPRGKRRQFEEPPDGTWFVDCDIDYLDVGEEGRRKTLPLTTLNPAWK